MISAKDLPPASPNNLDSRLGTRLSAIWERTPGLRDMLSSNGTKVDLTKSILLNQKTKCMLQSIRTFVLGLRANEDLIFHIKQ